MMNKVVELRFLVEIRDDDRPTLICTFSLGTPAWKSNRYSSMQDVPLIATLLFLLRSSAGASPPSSHRRSDQNSLKSLQIRASL